MGDLVAFSIGVRMTDEDQAVIREEYRDLGWYEAPVYGSLAFVSSDGSILHSYDVGSGNLYAVNLEWMEEVRNKKHKGIENAR